MHTSRCPDKIREKLLSLELTEELWTWLDMGLDIIIKSNAKRDLWHSHLDNVPDCAIADAINDFASLKHNGKYILENSSLWFCVFRVLVDSDKFAHNEYEEFKNFIERTCPNLEYCVNTNVLAKNNVGIFSKKFREWKWNEQDRMFRTYGKFKRYYEITEYFQILLFKKIGNNYS